MNDIEIGGIKMKNNYSFILEDNIERRRMDDKPLVNFFLWGIFILVGIIGAVIISMLIFPDLGSLFYLSCEVLGGLLGSTMGLCMIYLQTKRVNAFIERKTEWYTNIVEFTNKYSDGSKNLRKLNNLIDPEIFSTHIEIINLNNALIFTGIVGVLNVILSLTGEEQLGTISLTWFFIIIISVICVIIYEYPMNALWNKIQCFENEFDETLSEVWKENAWIEKPIKFHIDPSKKRNYFLWIFFSIISLGVMFIIWNYKIYTDPDFMYYRFHEKEDQILEVLEKIEQQKRSEIEN